MDVKFITGETLQNWIQIIDDTEESLSDLPVFIKIYDQQRQLSFFAPLRAIKIDTLGDPSASQSQRILSLQCSYSEMKGFSRNTNHQ